MYGRQAQESYRISPFHLFAFIGVAFYIAWLMLQYLNPLLTSPELAPDSKGIGPHLLFFVSTPLALVAAWGCSNRLSTPQGLRALVAVGILLAPLVSLGPYFIPANSAALAATLWALSGIGYAALLMLWTTVLVTLEGHRVILFLAAAAGAGAALFVFVLALVDSATFLFTALMPVLSALFFLISFRFRHLLPLENTELLSVSAADSDGKDPVSPSIIADSLSYAVCLGVGIWYALHELAYPANIICIGAACALACILMFVDALRFRVFTEKLQLKLFLPLAALTVFPLSFLSPPVTYVFVFLLFVAFVPSLLSNYGSASECIRVFELSPLRVFAYGRAWCILGALAGYLFAAYAFRGPWAAGNGVLLGFCALFALFILAATCLLRDHYPTSSEVKEDDDLELAPSEMFRDSLSERTEVVAGRFGLSPRQSEVLHLLAKGRNTSYIQEHLVISHYTAKAHIYNIYQKMGIHSRQDLLNLIEQVELGN
ncbi:MAG: helix-turn-helix transcriptional regulator [Coriobacteriales bacterium]|nr:helix-turn-helix transcriptional regulator [Coriobacteriales bacterium]